MRRFERLFSLRNLFLTVVLSQCFLHGFAQTWGTRFDYDYPGTVPVMNVMPPHYSGPPVRMRAAPRYRPMAVDPLLASQSVEAQRRQLELIADPFQPAFSRFGSNLGGQSYGGSYDSREGDFESPYPRVASTPAPTPAPAPEPSGMDKMSEFVSRLATTIPEIAEKMARMTPAPAPRMAAGVYTFEPPSVGSDGSEKNENLARVQKSGIGMFFGTDPHTSAPVPAPGSRSAGASIGDLVNSLPMPQSLLSFGNLFSALSGENPQPGASTAAKSVKTPDSEDNTVYDLSKVRGTPILKDLDEETEAWSKPDEVQIPTTSETPATTDTGENLIGSILNGNLGKIDWLGAFFNRNPGISGAGEQNPISQIFKGGFFGSGLDDDVEKITKNEDRNFS